MNNPEKKNIFRRILMSNIFENIYHFLLMYTWLLLSIAGAFVGLVIIIFVLEWMFPKDVHILNYALTDRTFKEAKSENDTKRTEIELMQLHDGNPYNDKIRQLGS